MRHSPSWLPPLDISLQSPVNDISRYELEWLGMWVWENIVFQEPVMFVDPAVIGIRVDFTTSPADAPPPSIVAMPVQMRLVHAIVPATVSPPAKVLA